jgi:hypothetical protein
MAERPAYALDVLAANYRICDDQRTSTRIPEDATRKEILRRRTAAPGFSDANQQASARLDAAN